MKINISASPTMIECIYLRATSGYVKEAEKLERYDSKINLHILLKRAATKKLRIRIWSYSLLEYLYVLTKSVTL